MVSIELQLLLIIWPIVIIVDYTLGAVMLYKTLKIPANEPQKKYFIGITCFFIAHATCRLFLHIRQYYFPYELRLAYIGSALGILSLVCVVYVIESVIYKKTKHIFTIYGLIGVAIDVIDVIFMTGLSLFLWVQTIFAPVLTVFIILIYFTHIFKSTESVRNHFIVMTIGIIIFGLGEIQNTPQAVALVSWAYIGAPLFMLAGLLILFIGVVKYYKINA